MVGVFAETSASNSVRGNWNGNIVNINILDKIKNLSIQQIEMESPSLYPVQYKFQRARIPHLRKK